MAKHFDKQFKLDAVQYYHDHKELGLQGCAKNLGISQQTLSRWQKELRDTGDITSRGSGNYIMGPLSRPLRKFLSVSSNKVSLRSKTAEVEIIWDLIT